MVRVTRLATLGFALLVSLLLGACGGGSVATFEGEPGADAVDGAEEELVVVPVDDRGFPTEWPIAAPPGTVIGCPNGEVIQETQTFSVVICLPDDPDPVTVAKTYLTRLRANGFAEREPGAFDEKQMTFLDGSGIEIYFQLIGDEATIVLIKAF